MESPPSAPSPRSTIRTYARRQDADHARVALADHNITAVVQEFYVTDPVSGKRAPRGCNLTVPAADAGEAARVLMRLPPSDTATLERDRHRPAGPPAPRLRTRVGPSHRQRSVWWLIALALCCSGAAILWFVNWLHAINHRPPPRPDPLLENYFTTDDINQDGNSDTEREYTPAGQLVQILEDRNFDGKFELRWIWQRGRLAYFDRDLDLNGKMDERTAYDSSEYPFYTDLRANGDGPVTTRRINREGVLWKILDDTDSDNHFDRLREYGVDGALLRDEPLPRDSAENNIPQPQPLPAPAVEGEGGNVSLKPS